MAVPLVQSKCRNNPSTKVPSGIPVLHKIHNLNWLYEPFAVELWHNLSPASILDTSTSYYSSLSDDGQPDEFFYSDDTTQDHYRLLDKPVVNSRETEVLNCPTNRSVNVTPPRLPPVPPVVIRTTKSSFGTGTDDRAARLDDLSNFLNDPPPTPRRRSGSTSLLPYQRGDVVHSNRSRSAVLPEVNVTNHNCTWEHATQKRPLDDDEWTNNVTTQTSNTSQYSLVHYSEDENDNPKTGHENCIISENSEPKLLGQETDASINMTSISAKASILRSAVSTGLNDSPEEVTLKQIPSLTLPAPTTIDVVTPLLSRDGHVLYDGTGALLYKIDLTNLPNEERFCPLRDDVKLICHVGSGFYGTIYKAYVKGRLCAIKVPLKTVDTSKSRFAFLVEEQAATLQREINCMRTLDKNRTCTNIMDYWGVLDKDVPVPIAEAAGEIVDHLSGSIVMSYIEGASLYELLYDGYMYLSALARHELTLQLLKAVRYLHNQSRFLHRDIKTANLILEQLPSLRGVDNLNRDELHKMGSFPEEPLYKLTLCDFGKSMPFDTTNYVCLPENGGTPRYMAPESYQVGTYVNEASDIWSVACCVIELLGGPVPYEENHNWDAGPHTMNRPPTVPSTYPVPLRRVLTDCFNFDWRLRPSIDALIHTVDSTSIQELHSLGFSLKSYHAFQVDGVQTKIERSEDVLKFDDDDDDVPIYSGSDDSQTDDACIGSSYLSSSAVGSKSSLMHL